MSLSVMLALNARALMVVVEATEMGLEYKADVDVGSTPLVVYLMLAPLVVQLSVTLWDEE